MLDPERRHLIAYIAAAGVLVLIAARLVGGDGRGAEPPVSIAASAPGARAASRATVAASTVPGSAQPGSGAGGLDRSAGGEGGTSIWVDVAGAVRRPGLYSLPRDARVAAALERAGGVRPRADRAAVNLAAKLTDGQQVFVPMRGGAGATSIGARSPGAVGAGAGAAASPGASSPAAGTPISLSNASQAQLEQLDGIGPALAARIIEYREANGGFRSTDQLREVSGIGDKRFDALKDAITP